MVYILPPRQDVDPPLRVLQQETGVYQHNGRIYAELHTDERLEYEFSAKNHPPIPIGYEGAWSISAEELPRLEFICRPNLNRLYDENIPEWEKRDQQRRRRYAHTSESHGSGRPSITGRDPIVPHRRREHTNESQRGERDEHDERQSQRRFRSSQ